MRPSHLSAAGLVVLMIGAFAIVTALQLMSSHADRLTAAMLAGTWLVLIVETVIVVIAALTQQRQR